MKIDIRKIWFLFLPTFVVLFFPTKSLMSGMTFSDLFIVVGLVLVLFTTTFNRHLNKIHLYLIVLIVFSFISFAVNYTGDSNILYSIRLIEYFIVYTITYHLYDSSINKYINKGILICLLLLFSFSILQNLYPQIINIADWGPSWKNDYVVLNKIRAYSLLDNPLNLVAVVSIILGYILVVPFRYKRLSILVSYTTLFFTGSKIALVIIFFSAIYLIFRYFIKRKVKVVYIGLLALSIMAGVIVLLNSQNSTIYKRLSNKTEVSGSYNQRVLIFNSSIDMLYDNPIFGIGSGNFKSVYNKKYRNEDASIEESSYTAENFFLEFYLDHGLIPFLIIIYITLSIVFFAILNYKDQMLIAVAIAILLFLSVGLTTNLRAVPLMMFFFYFIAIFYKHKSVIYE